MLYPCYKKIPVVRPVSFLFFFFFFFIPRCQAAARPQGAAALAERWRGPPVDLVVASPLSRALATADLFFGGLPGPRPGRGGRSWSHRDRVKERLPPNYLKGCSQTPPTRTTPVRRGSGAALP